MHSIPLRRIRAASSTDVLGCVLEEGRGCVWEDEGATRLFATGHCTISDRVRLAYVGITAFTCFALRRLHDVDCDDVFKSIARRFCEKITERQYERCQRGGATQRPDFGRRRRRGFPRLHRRAPVPGGFPGD